MVPIATGSILHEAKGPQAKKSYRYVHIDRTTKKIIDSEKFNRTSFSSTGRNDDKPLNEFYGRSWTYRETKKFKQLKQFPMDYQLIKAKNLHPDNEIPTMHITAPDGDIERLHGYYLQDIDIKANITYITSKKVFHFNNNKLQLGGRSNRYFTKFSYNIKLDKGSKLDGYKKIKLRSCASDPSYMREKLAYEMLLAAGRPVSRTSYVRVFINDRPMGLFLLGEKYDDHWLRNEFAKGDKSYQTGILYEGEGVKKSNKHAADLSYHGDDLSYYTSSAYSISEKPEVGTNSMNDLVSFTKFIDDQLKLQQTNGNNASASLDEWNKHIDLNGFFISLGLEFLMGSFDTYLQNTNNYFLYKDPIEDRFVFLSWDFDMGLGSGPVKFKRLIGGDYKKFDGMDLRPLTKATVMSKTRPEFGKLFESQLTILVKELFHPNITFPIIDSWVNFIQEDVVWDRSLSRARKGSSFIPFGPHNIENWFHNNATGDTVSKPLTISYLTALDFVIRVNSKKLTFDRAINGPTHHSSLYGLKNWIKEKVDNVLPFLPK
ncbi:coth protein-domain-containing protein [Cunninghamella echinulata]|nr:coth protein-domain-containing protein [Cunninghamella echinulata]